MSGRKASGAVETPAPASLGAFRLKEDKKEDISVGSYFRRQKERETSGSGSVAAALRDDRTLAELALEKEKKEESKRKRSQEGHKENDVKKKRFGDVELPRRDSLPGEESSEARRDMFKTFEPKPEKVREKMEKPKKETSAAKVSDVRKENKAIKKDLNERVKMFKAKKEGQSSSMEEVKTEMKTEAKGRAPDSKRRTPEANGRAPEAKRQVPETGLSQEVKSKIPPKKVAPFVELFKGVVFAISGFQNPLRGEIRQKALEMGAKYEGDWSSR